MTARLFDSSRGPESQMIGWGMFRSTGGQGVLCGECTGVGAPAGENFCVSGAPSAWPALGPAPHRGVCDVGWNLRQGTQRAQPQKRRGLEAHRMESTRNEATERHEN